MRSLPGHWDACHSCRRLVTVSGFCLSPRPALRCGHLGPAYGRSVSHWLAGWLTGSLALCLSNDWMLIKINLLSQAIFDEVDTCYLRWRNVGIQNVRYLQGLNMRWVTWLSGLSALICIHRFTTHFLTLLLQEVWSCYLIGFFIYTMDIMETSSVWFWR